MYARCRGPRVLCAELPERDEIRFCMAMVAMLAAVHGWPPRWACICGGAYALLCWCCHAPGKPLPGGPLAADAIVFLLLVSDASEDYKEAGPGTTIFVENFGQGRVHRFHPQNTALHIRIRDYLDQFVSKVQRWWTYFKTTWYFKPVAAAALAVLLGPVLYILWCLLALVWEAIVGSYHMLPVGMSLLFLDDRFVRSGGPSITRDKKQLQ